MMRTLALILLLALTACASHAPVVLPSPGEVAADSPVALLCTMDVGKGVVAGIGTHPYMAFSYDGIRWEVIEVWRPGDSPTVAVLLGHNVHTISARPGDYWLTRADRDGTIRAVRRGREAAETWLRARDWQTHGVPDYAPLGTNSNTFARRVWGADAPLGRRAWGE